MGNPASKIESPQKTKSEDLTKTESDGPRTPLVHRRVKLLQDDLDPRSPSTNIVRTPLQYVLNTPPEAQVEDKAYDTFNINSPTPKLKKVSIDPRSPTIDFSRTPIVLPNDNDTEAAAQYKKNLENAKKTLISITPKKLADLPSQAPPKLLAVTPLKKKEDKRRHSMAGVLETNLDFIETDLDAVFAEKMKIKSPSKSDIVKSTRDDELVTPSEKEEVETINEVITVVEDDGLIVQIAHSETFTVTEQVDEELEEGIIIEKVDANSDDNVVEENVVAKVEEEIGLNNELEFAASNIISSDITEFSKKVNNLIYTESSEVSEATTPKRNIQNIKGRSRTPLGIRNANPRRSIPKLRVSDKPKNRKSEYSVSKIPVFKDKRSSLISKQCENTPPTELQRLRKAKWDTDNTLII